MKSIEDVLWWDPVYLQQHYKPILWLTLNASQHGVIEGLYLIVLSAGLFLGYGSLSKELLFAYIVAGLVTILILVVISGWIKAWQRKQLHIVLVDDEGDEYGRKTKIQDWSEDLI